MAPAAPATWWQTASAVVIAAFHTTCSPGRLPGFPSFGCTPVLPSSEPIPATTSSGYSPLRSPRCAVTGARAHPSLRLMPSAARLMRSQMIMFPPMIKVA